MRLTNLRRRNDAPTAADESRALALALVLAVAVALRVVGLEAQSLTMDELADVGSATASLTSVIHTRDGFPPLSGILLHAWMSVVASEPEARWLSVILGVLTIPVVWRLGTLAGGPRAGMLAAAALAISPFHRWFSQEARAYALYLLTASTALWLFFRAMATNRQRDWLLYAVACTGGMYAHYYFALLPLTAGVLRLVETRNAQQLRPAAVAYAALALACLPLLVLLREDLAYQSGYALDAPFTVVTAGYAYFTAIVGFSLGPSLRELHSLAATTALRMVLPWVLLVGACAGVMVAAAAAKRERRREVVRLVLLATLPTAFGGALSEIGGVGFRVRYIAWIAIPIIVLLAIGVASIPSIALRAATAGGLIVACAISITNRLRVERYWNEDVAALANYLHAARARGTPVFVTAKYMAIPVQYYLGTGWRVCALPDVDQRDAGADPGAALRVIAAQTAPDSMFWLVYTRTFHSDRRGELPRALGGRAAARARFAGITLYQGMRPPNIVAAASCADPNPLPNPEGNSAAEDRGRSAPQRAALAR